MTELPKKYKAVVYDEPGKVSTKIVELDVRISSNKASPLQVNPTQTDPYQMPEPGPGEVLVNLYVPRSFHHTSV